MLKRYLSLTTRQIPKASAFEYGSAILEVLKRYLSLTTNPKGGSPFGQLLGVEALSYLEDESFLLKRNPCPKASRLSARTCWLSSHEQIRKASRLSVRTCCLSSQFFLPVEPKDSKRCLREHPILLHEASHVPVPHELRPLKRILEMKLRTVSISHHHRQAHQIHWNIPWVDLLHQSHADPTARKFLRDCYYIVVTNQQDCSNE